jgi:hypothetical protein
MTQAFKKVRKAIDRNGILLLTDAELPSLTALIAGEPVKGSWWGHPQGNLMYNLSNELADQKDLLLVKGLLNKKLTFLQQQHWDALFAIGSAKQEWQTKKLKAPAKKLLTKLTKAGELPAGDPKIAANIELSLLAYSESVHTDSGKHIKVLRTWAETFRTKSYQPKKMSYDEALAHFEKIRCALSKKDQTKVCFPWDE